MKINHVTSHAASISFFTIFSVPPLLIIIIFIADLIIDDALVHQYMFEYISKYINPNVAGDIQIAVEKANNIESGVISSIVGFGLLVWSSNAIFIHFKRGLQVVFRTNALDARNVRQKIWDIASSLVVIGGLGIFMLFFILIDVGISIIDLKSHLKTLDSLGPFPIIFNLFSLMTHALLFFMFYKILGRPTQHSKTLWIGAIIASTFFTFGKSFLLTYVISSRWSNVYGAAGNFVIFLLWMYYNAYIVLIGAQISQSLFDQEIHESTV
ncbi:MAG: YihY/virulence factor BrkB family protein [Bdellovibrionales bacterium]|nr:YihY/virulence factor BrkB family protein [Bdellovibrionales bacterium]